MQTFEYNDTEVPAVVDVLLLSGQIMAQGVDYFTARIEYSPGGSLTDFDENGNELAPVVQVPNLKVHNLGAGAVKATVDAVIAAHSPPKNNWDQSADDYEAKLNAAIDARLSHHNLI